jgi:hypothetical protein
LSGLLLPKYSKELFCSPKCHSSQVLGQAYLT